MNYRHTYHAGNFADVVKHLLLTTVIQAVSRKPTPFCFLETHAGVGLYALNEARAQKNKEYENGIGKLFFDQSSVPAFAQPYLDVVRQYNAPNKLAYYPGSPLIALSLLREHDKMICCELHPEDYVALKENFRHQSQVAVHHLDGYLGLKAFLPPKLKRGLVLIDPPFEQPNEFEKIAESVKAALQHWCAGHYLIWYPIKSTKKVADFYRLVKTWKIPYLGLQFTLDHNPSAALSSCGVLLLNPPWKMDVLWQQTVLPYLSHCLTGRGVVFSR